MLLPSGTFESYKLPITECLRQLATEVTTSVAWGAARSLKNPDHVLTDLSAEGNLLPFCTFAHPARYSCATRVM